MAAIDYNTLFTRLGKIGKIGYVLAGDQAAVPALLTTLINQYTGTADEDLIGSIVTNQASIPTPVVTPPSTVSALAVTTLIRMVQASVSSISSQNVAMAELIRQMRADGQYVNPCTVSIASAALSTNIGSGVVVVSTKRGDGLVQENLFAEISRLACTQDSYTGGATSGLEQFQLSGQPSIVGLWNYNYPTGSGAAQSVTAISASTDAATTGNILTNSDFENWSGPLSTDSLDNWTLETGAYGTDIQQSTTAFSGTNSLRFLPTAANTAIYQQFADSTTGTAVTPTSYTSYPVNFWMRSLAGVPGAGVLTVELVDDTGTVINDGQGVANSFTQAMTALTTTWVPVNGVFRIPEVPPDVMRLRLRMSTALTTQSVLVDRLAMGPFTAAYPGGYNFAVFSGGTPFTAGDAFNLTATNNRAGATYLATFQALFDRFFGMRQNGFLLPSSGSTLQPDTKITA